MASGDYFMSYQEPLSKHTVAISISESSDMAVLGLSEEHLNDAMAEIARHLLAMGARLIYGGDLRPGGFTEVLFELITRHRRDADLGDERTGVTNFFSWPAHISLTFEEVKKQSEALIGVADLVFLTTDGQVMSTDERQQQAPRQATEVEWADGLTAMRNLMTRMSHARIILGGRVEGYKGKMPGVAEEALSTLQASQPLFLLGGFGGCARDIAEDLGLASSWPVPRLIWNYRKEFAAFTSEALNNGLTPEENVLLATTVHIDQAITLILRGLLRKGGNSSPTEGGS